MYGRVSGVFSVDDKEEGTLVREPLVLAEGNLNRLGRYRARTSSPEATATSGSLTRLGNSIAGSSRIGVRQERMVRREDC